ncbi:unnamed protein product [Auanema sp. JU1783]|nr:unnamed protein product [Auanema sp. JU1783]
MPWHPQPGDLIQFHKHVYSHWAVFVNDDYLIHVQAPDGGRKSGTVTIGKQKLDSYLNEHFVGVTLWDLFNNQGKSGVQQMGCLASVNNRFDKIKKPFAVDEIIRRAESRAGDNWEYDLFKHNCEHFAHWCRNGVKVSKQSPNATVYETEDGAYVTAQAGGTNLGPIDFKLLSYDGGYHNSNGRAGVHSNAELYSYGIANTVRTTVGMENHYGGYAGSYGAGYQAETKFVKADVGPVSATLGASMSTGVDFSDGVKAEVLGTGFQADSDKVTVKLFGNSVGVTYPWKWFK